MLNTKKLVLWSTILLPLISPHYSFGAKSVNLRHQSLMYLQSFNSLQANNAGPSLKQMKVTTDFNQTTHIRLKQHYAGHPVWGADAVVHIPASPKNGGNKLNSLLAEKDNKAVKINGTVYQELSPDLQNTPAYVFQASQAQKATQEAIMIYDQENGTKPLISKTKNQLIVYVDKQNKAHWAFLIHLLAQPAKKLREEPTYIMDAITFEIYEKWNNFKTLDSVLGGGYGGNYNEYWLYDDTRNDIERTKWFSHHYPALSILRDTTLNICYMQNDSINVLDNRTNNTVSQFLCAKPDEKHNNIYWNEQFDMVNGGFSPSNDVLFNAVLVQDMYEQWLELPILVNESGDPMTLDLIVHAAGMGSNAGWSDFTLDVQFGDGDDEEYYPFVSLDVVAHELSHGFTSQNSGLVYDGQSGALNESFSDMASKAAEAYAPWNTDGYINWTLGQSISKEDKPIRYLNNPRQDCIGVPDHGMCSIDNVKDYIEGIDMHYASGIFNKAFYLLSTAPNWNVKKAFTVMAQANLRYWTPRTNFIEAACGVMDAAHDYGYDLDTITKVMSQVGIDTHQC